jgi:hypothetical protein
MYISDPAVSCQHVSILIFINYGDLATINIKIILWIANYVPLHLLKKFSLLVLILSPSKANPIVCLLM